MIKSIKPLYDKVLIKPLKEEEQMKGAILTMANESDAKLGKVVSVGPGMRTLTGTFISTSLLPGDVVVLPKIGAQRVEIEGEEYWVIAEKEIIGVATQED